MMNFVPRVHGNGFVQVDLTPTRRLHIWGHPEIPSQKIPTQIHDHAFSFKSRILMGCLQDIRYREVPDPNGLFMIHRVNVREREDTTLHPTGERVTLQGTSQYHYRSGDEYLCKAGHIHQSIPKEWTISIIEKTGPTLSQGGPSPRVFVEMGLRPDNDFSRYQLSETKLWEIIAEVLMKARV